MIAHFVVKVTEILIDINGLGHDACREIVYMPSNDLRASPEIASELTFLVQLFQFQIKTSKSKIIDNVTTNKFIFISQIQLIFPSCNPISFFVAFSPLEYVIRSYISFPSKLS